MTNQRRRTPPPEPVDLPTAEPVDLPTAEPPLLVAHLQLSAEELQQATLKLSDEDKRDLLAFVLETMAEEEPTAEDVADIQADADSWRSQEPEVFALALVARVVGRSLVIKNLQAELLSYTAGHTPAKQHALKQRLRLALSTIVQVGQEAGRVL